MYKETLRPAWVEINLAALDYNVKQIQAKIGENKKIIGVIKADAYGHGALAAAEILRKNGIDIFAVATLSEAISLRDDGAQEEIIVLGLVPDMYAATIAEYDLTPVVCTLENARAISDAATALGKTIRALIAVDTGMGRIGYMVESDSDLAFAVDEAIKMQDLPAFEIAGVISHMSTADETDKSFAREQEKKYDAFCEALTAAGITAADGKSLRTFANSAAVMELASTHYDAVRPGIILYGCYPSAEVDKNELDIAPVMSVKANIVHLKEVPTGFYVGYGRKYISEKPSKIATIALGYADGYPRTYSHGGKIIINGVYAPIAGNICMDQFMVDVTDVPDVKVGDEAIIMGSNGTLAITAEDIANATGTINYEILCDFGTRLPKVYKYFKSE